MKSLHQIPLKNLAASLLTLVFLLLIAEYFILQHRFGIIQEVEDKSDFVHQAQINSQQIALDLQLYLAGQKELAPAITAQVNAQDHYFQILSDGGRIDRSDIFLEKLSRLEQITYANLLQSWQIYKGHILNIITETDGNAVAAQPTVADSTKRDSTAQKPVQMVSVSQSAVAVAKAKKLVFGEWLTLGEWYSKLNDDILDEKAQKQATLSAYFISFGILDLLVLGSIFVAFRRFVIDPISKIENNTVHQIQTANVGNNEIGSLTICINETIEHLKDATDFVEKIGEGNLSIDYKELDPNYAAGKNKLADSLISMQGKLKALNDEEQRRQWANEGLTKFVDILRSSDDNISTLGDNIISALVKYTGSNQGGLYVLNDEQEGNHYLELISLFAFDVKKYETQRLKLGEGILGQTFLEKETTHLTEIPEEYVRITSGLGDAAPKSVLLVPLKVDKEVYGIVELASFKAYQEHEISFVERLGETIASTLATVKSAQRNKQLIAQFQDQTEQMKAQEEEMRQNMEELQATQEEIARKESEYIDRIRELEAIEAAHVEAKNEAAELTNTLAIREQEYQGKLAALEKTLQARPEKGDDWGLAMEVEKALRINLEALKIARAELSKKRG